MSGSLQLCCYDELCCSGETPVLYQVLPEKSSAVGGAMMGSSHVYDMAAVSEHCTCVYLSHYLPY